MAAPTECLGSVLLCFVLLSSLLSPLNGTSWKNQPPPCIVPNHVQRRNYPPHSSTSREAASYKNFPASEDISSSNNNPRSDSKTFLSPREPPLKGGPGRLRSIFVNFIKTATHTYVTDLACVSDLSLGLCQGSKILEKEGVEVDRNRKEIDDIKRELERMREELREMRREEGSWSSNELEEDVGGVGIIEGEATSTIPSAPMIPTAPTTTTSLKLPHSPSEYSSLIDPLLIWCQKMFDETEEDGWIPVPCMRAFKNVYNKEGKTECFIKWMEDHRTGVNNGVIETGKDNENLGEKGQLFPCIKCFTTINAPPAAVHSILSSPEHVNKYNDFVKGGHRDLATVSPDTKICWGKSPKILFIKPREFITLCHYRWLGDGSEVVVNEAVDVDISQEEGGKADGGRVAAYALRGANVISPVPNHPGKTYMALLAHADPGGNLPSWALKTAVNTLAPREPYKLFWKIEKAAQDLMKKSENVAVDEGNCSYSDLPKRKRPSGISQLGYACFWNTPKEQQPKKEQTR